MSLDSVGGKQAETYLASEVMIDKSPATEGEEEKDGEDRMIRLSHDGRQDSRVQRQRGVKGDR